MIAHIQDRFPGTKGSAGARRIIVSRLGQMGLDSSVQVFSFSPYLLEQLSMWVPPHLQLPIYLLGTLAS